MPHLTSLCSPVYVQMNFLSVGNMNLSTENTCPHTLHISSLFRNQRLVPVLNEFSSNVAEELVVFSLYLNESHVLER